MVAAHELGPSLAPYAPRLLSEWLRDQADASVREVPGTLAFVDISGFTRLTERLARRGKVGAEEMSELLDATFGALLRDAEADGADLVKWGGDAVLLLFQGPAHELRACRAAARMRRTLRSVGHLRTSVGPVVLRMSVGLHTGRFTFALVGDPLHHRELIIAGPAASTTAEMESTASAGEIVLSRELAQAVGPRWTGAPRGGGVLLRAEPVLPDDLAPQPPDLDVDVTPALPVPIRAALLAGLGEPEHRSIAVGFVRFSGTDAVLRDEGSEALAAALDHVVRVVQHATAAHDVTFFESDIDRDGGKLLLTAGAPRALGREPERMLRTAVDIVGRAARLPMQMGVSYGHVFAGGFGPAFRRTYSVKGDAVNLAARLTARAQPGSVVATWDVIDRCAVPLTVQTLVPFTVKGKARPVEAAIVSGVGRSRDVGAVDLLVGREAELDRLLAGGEEAVAGRGQVLELVGEPGIGKSRLLAELVHRSTDATVLNVACGDHRGGPPYGVARDLVLDGLGLALDADPAEVVERLVEVVTDEVPQLRPWLPLLAVPLDVEVPATRETSELDERYRRARVADVTVQLLSEVVRGPVLVVVDDAHLADEASAEILERLAVAADTLPWCVVVSHRGGVHPQPAAARPATTTMTLPPLATEAAMALAEVVTEDAPLSPATVERLTARAGGNPLFLVELVRTATRGGDLDTLPETVEDLVAAEVDQLPHTDRAVLRLAAVLGTSFARWELAEVLRLQAGGNLQTATRLEGFLLSDEGDRLRFRHTLLRDVAYEGLPYRRRRELHATVGLMLERSLGDAAADRLAVHFSAAGDWGRAWRYARTAGSRARSRYAHAEAAELLGRAAEAARAAGDVPEVEQAEVLESLGDVLFLDGRSTEALAAYRQARRLSREEPVRVSRLRLQEARVDQRLGRHVQALGLLSRGLRAIEGRDDALARALRSKLATRYAIGRVSQGRYREARRWALVAIEEATAAGDTDSLAHAHLAMHTVELWSSTGQGEAHAERALALFAETGNLDAQAHVLNNLAIRALFEGSWTQALDMFGRAADGFRRVGNAADEANAAYNSADVLVRQGRVEEAEPLLSTASRVARAVGDEELVALVLREQGRAAARGGHPAEAQSLLAEARTRFEDLGEPQEVVETDAAIAECLLLGSDAPAAATLAADALERARALGATTAIPSLHRVLGTALLHAGRLDDAWAELQAGLAATVAPEVRHERGFLLAALARTARHRGDEAAVPLGAEGRAVLDALGVVSVPLPREPERDQRATGGLP